MTTSNIPRRAVQERKTFSVTALFRGSFCLAVIGLGIYMVAKILTS